MPRTPAAFDAHRPRSAARDRQALRQRALMQRSWSLASRALEHGRSATAARMRIRALRMFVERKATGVPAPARWAYQGAAARTGPAVTPALTPPHRTPPSSLRLIGRWGEVDLTRSLLEGFLRYEQPHLLVDKVRAEIRLAGKQVGLPGCDRILDILSVVARARGAAVSALTVYERVWGRKLHDPLLLRRVHDNVSRLRQILAGAAGGIELLRSGTDGYSIPPRFSTILVEFSHSRSGEKAFADIEKLLDEVGLLDNRTYRQRCSVSRSTAANRLQRWVALGLLERSGQGRTARYRRRDPSPSDR
jgi:hypothetical protein